MLNEEQRGRFFASLSPDPSGCLLWIGSLCKGGYGCFWFNGHLMAAHRLAWLLDGRELPEGKVLRHSCDIRRCVNLDHLSVGTQLDNALDMSCRCRGARGVLPYGVYRLPGKKTKPFGAQVRFLSKKYSLGKFATIEEATSAARSGKISLLASIGRKIDSALIDEEMRHA